MFEEIMQAAKDTWGPTFFPLNLEIGNFVQHFSNTDGDLTGLHAFHFAFDPEDPSQPANPEVTLQIEDELFLRVLERVRHFWEMGFIDPRLAIPAEAGIVIGEASEAGEYLFSTGQYAFGHTASAQASRGIDSRFVPLSRPIVSTMSAAGSGFGISVYSQNQEAAMQFLNAWYTDNELAVILTEGIEGLHWEYNAEGLIVPDPERQYNTWRFGMGNIFVLTPRETDGHGYFEGFRDYNAAGTATALLGFVFNSEPVALEMAALTGVVEEWRPSITVGALDLDDAVPAYLAALRANGVDRVLEELNNQIQEFLANR
jgi:putative aldouronate transport system substrate-binding protein